MSLYETFKQELVTIFTDAAIVLTVIGGVILYAFLYPQPYIKQSVTSLPISVVDYDKSELSRKIVFMLDSSAQVDVVRRDLSEKDAKEALLQGSVKGLVVIPHNFQRDVLLKKHPTIAVGSDASYFLVYGGVLEAALTSVMTKAVKLKVANILKEGKTMQQAVKQAVPIKMNIINFFNPDNSYTQYVVPAVFVLILQQIIFIGLGIVGGGVNERAYRNYDYSAPPFYVVLSRILIFFVLFFLHMLFYFGYVFNFFEIIHMANMSDLLGFASLFLLSASALGVLFGVLLPTREMATPLVLMSSLVLVFSAGFVWPSEAIPDWIEGMMQIFPSSVAITGFLKLNQMGAPLDMLRPNMWVLLVQFCIYFMAAFLLLRRKQRAR